MLEQQPLAHPTADGIIFNSQFSIYGGYLPIFEVPYILMFDDVCVIPRWNTVALLTGIELYSGYEVSHADAGQLHCTDGRTLSC